MHPYEFYGHFTRVPVFEERVDNIVGIVYAMDMLEFVEKVSFDWNLDFWFNFLLILGHLFVLCLGAYAPLFVALENKICLLLKVDQLESSTVGEIAHKPAFFVPGT